jgi:hypothetical protein
MLVAMARIIYDLRYTIYAAVRQHPRQSRIVNRKSAAAPSGLDVRDADFDFFGGERRAEFKNLDVLRLYEWFERGEINRA